MTNKSEAAADAVDVHSESNQHQITETNEKSDPFHTYDEVLRERRALGLMDSAVPSLERPSDELSADIATDGAAITELFCANQAWAGFAGSELAKTNAQLVQVQNQVSVRQYNVIAAYRRTAAAQCSTEEAKAELWSDPEFCTLMLRQQRLTQLKLLLESDLARLRGNLAIVSRIVAVRGQDVQLAGRPPRTRSRK